jgi:cysteine desulfurase
VGFGVAAELAQKELLRERDRLTDLRDRLISCIMAQVSGVKLNGHPERRLPNNVNISVDGVSGEAMLLKLDLAGVCASTGSACNSESTDPSHVLRAMGHSRSRPKAACA